MVSCVVVIAAVVFILLSIWRLDFYYMYVANVVVVARFLLFLTMGGF